MAKKPTRPKDTNQLVKRITDLATGQHEEIIPKQTKNPAAVELGRLGGLKGGNARASKLTPEQRKEIATKATQKRLGNKN